VPDSPVDMPSSPAPAPEPETGKPEDVTETFDGEIGLPEAAWAGLSTSDLETPSLGSVLDFGELGTFKLEKCLGRGGMGEVYKARQVGPKGFSQLVAIKRLRPGRHQWEEQSFVDEARVLAMLRHENIARVHGFFEQEGNAYLVMEYIEGPTLYSVLEQARRRGDHFSEKAACEITAEMAEALHYAHRATDEAGRPLQLVHRDVSTTNILITETGRAKLVDFGVAYSKLEGRTETSSASTIIKGKAPYLSPEQVKHLPVDGRSDLFSLGTILVEMLTGEPPFGWTADHSTLRRIAQVTPEYVAAATTAVSKELRAICQKLLAREPDQRFASGGEVAQALRRHAAQHDGPALVQEEVGRLQGLPGAAAPRPRATSGALREIKRLRRVLMAAGVLALALLTVLAWYAHRVPSPSQPTMNRSDVNAAPPAATATSCWKALALAHVVAVVACRAHLPPGAQGNLCSSTPAREVLGPQGMTPLPVQFFVDFVSLQGDRVCTGPDRSEPCPFGEGPLVARMSWRDPRTDAFSPGLGPHRNDRPLLHGHAFVVPITTGALGEVLNEPGYIEHPRIADARMMVVFTDLQTLNGIKHPICGVLYWQDGKEGIPILAAEYYGERVAAEWGETSFVTLY